MSESWEFVETTRCGKRYYPKGKSTTMILKLFKRKCLSTEDLAVLAVAGCSIKISPEETNIYQD